jgi:hypothetical protein
MIGLILVILVAVVWSIIWKARALWVAGNRKEKIWFIILFFVNTLGILDIAYLLTRKDKKQKSALERILS